MLWSWRRSPGARCGRNRRAAVLTSTDAINALPAVCAPSGGALRSSFDIRRHCRCPRLSRVRRTGDLPLKNSRRGFAPRPWGRPSCRSVPSCQIASSYEAWSAETASGRSFFLSRDPIEEAGGLNLYGFCGNDPVNKWDYQGKMPAWLKTVCKWLGFDVNTDPHGNNTPDPTIGSGPSGQNANGEGGSPVAGDAGATGPKSDPNNAPFNAQLNAPSLTFSSAPNSAGTTTPSILSNVLRVGWSLIKNDPLGKIYIGIVANAAFGGLFTDAPAAAPVTAENTSVQVGDYTLSDTVAGHMSETVGGTGTYSGQLARPYLSSPSTIDEIISTGQGVPDPQGVPGLIRYDVPGAFRGSDGTWELLHDPATNTIYHFNFTGGGGG